MTNEERVNIEASLTQEQIVESSLANGDGPWTIVCDHWEDSNGCGGRYVALAQPTLRNQVLDKTSWDLTKGRGIPGFVQSNDEVEYFRIYESPDFEPLVIVQHFHGAVPDSILISEEFRLLMNLWYDPKSGNYFRIEEDGSKEPAVKVDAHKVEIRTPILKNYLAARQLDAILFVDSTTSEPTPKFASAFAHLETERSDGSRICLSRNISDSHYGTHRVFSRVLVKKILFAPPRDTCGIWPWDEVPSRDYPEFIIGEDEHGKAVKYTCDPDRLADYFGANPDAPHYLTPVFFKPEVLQKYYDNPSLYKVSDGYLSCARMWGVELDNDDLEFVAVFLGDIGRDIPPKHWTHWLSYNIPPTQTMSETAIRRSFLNQFVVASNPEHIFKASYEKLNNTWKEYWGWPLFRREEGRIANIIQRLRIPLNETDTELEAQLLNLALALVDPLNVKGLHANLSKRAGEPSIATLERFLKDHSYKHTDRDIALFRKVQRMRSKVAAHDSGSERRLILEKELADQSPRQYVEHLMLEMAQTMDSLTEFTERSALKDSAK